MFISKQWTEKKKPNEKKGIYYLPTHNPSVWFVVRKEKTFFFIYDFLNTDKSIFRLIPHIKVKIVSCLEFEPDKKIIQYKKRRESEAIRKCVWLVFCCITEYCGVTLLKYADDVEGKKKHFESCSKRE